MAPPPRDADVRHDPALVQEAEELASIFAASIKTARQNSRRQHDSHDS
jgi:hypothetical protein